MRPPWERCEVLPDTEVPTAPTLRLLSTLGRQQLASGLFDWLAGRAVLRRLAITEHRPGMSRLIDRTGVDADNAAGGSRGWPLGGEGLRWCAIDAPLVRWLHGHGPGGWRVAIGHDGDEACVLVAGEAAAVYAIHASRDHGLGGFPADELQRWAKAAVVLRQLMLHRPASRPPTTRCQRIERAAARLQEHAPKLSPRESQVVARIACGLTNDGISADLGISPATVLTLRRRAYAKLGIRRCVELSWLAD